LVAGQGDWIIHVELFVADRSGVHPGGGGGGCGGGSGHGLVMVLAQMVEIGEVVELVAFHRSEQWLHDEVQVFSEDVSLKKEFRHRQIWLSFSLELWKSFLFEKQQLRR
jgi:hypothetical protein